MHAFAINMVYDTLNTNNSNVFAVEFTTTTSERSKYLRSIHNFSAY